MKKPKFKISDILFVVFIALLLIPQTRTPIQVALNTLKVAIWSPRVKDVEDQQHIEPFGYVVKDLKGQLKTIPIGQGKITFLSYWATWCPPCLAELPGIQAVFNDYGDSINFVLLTQEDTPVVQQFLDKKGYDLPVYFPQMQAPERLSSKSIPTNYVMDAQGTILMKETGAADWNSAKVRAMLDGLLQN